MNIIQISRGKFSQRFDTNNGRAILAGEFFEALEREKGAVIENLNILDWGVAENEADLKAQIREINKGDLFLGIAPGKMTKVGSRGSIQSGGELPINPMDPDNPNPDYPIPPGWDGKYPPGTVIFPPDDFNQAPGTIYVYEGKDPALWVWGHPTKSIELRHGDMLYIDKYITISNPDGTTKTLPDYWHINNAGGEAKSTIYESTLWNMPETINNVQEALVWVDGNKMQVGGRGALEVNLTADQKYTITIGGRVVKPGNIYQITETPAELTVRNLLNWQPDLGMDTIRKFDFLVVHWPDNISSNDLNNETRRQELLADIHSFKIKALQGGASNADDLEWDIEVGDHRGDIIASTDHADSDGEITNVGQALDVIFKTKADLDGQGKIYVSQLPDTVLGALQFKGQIQSNIIGVDSAPEKGDYYIYTGPDVTLSERPNVIIQDVEDPTSQYSVDITYNKETTQKIRSGDWVIFSDSEWVDGDTPGSPKKQKITQIDLIDHSEGFTHLTTTSADGDLVTYDKHVNFKATKRSGVKISVGSDVSEQVVVDINSTGNNGTAEFTTANVVIATEDANESEAFFPVMTVGKHLSKNILSVVNNNLVISDGSNIVSKDTTLIFSDAAVDGESVELIIPGKSGTLARMEDLAEELLKNGTKDYHQKVVEVEKDGEIVKELGNSKLKDTDTAETFSGLGDGGRYPTTAGVKTPTQIREELNNGKSGITLVNGNSKVGIGIDLKEGNPNTSIQFIPTHSGTLINDWSIIDCGVWE